MAITLDVIDKVAALIEEIGVGEKGLACLRDALPDIHFTLCHDDDVVGPKPVHESNTFNLYLVDGRDHCLTLTNDAAAATGVVVAEVGE